MSCLSGSDLRSTAGAARPPMLAGGTACARWRAPPPLPLCMPGPTRSDGAQRDPPSGAQARGCTSRRCARCR
eukprot:5401655-Prymnesium_polylepis.2